MGWIGAALTGASALAGLFGNKKQVSDTTTDRTTAPVYDAQSGAFRDYLINSFMGSMNDNGSFDNAYKAQGLNSIRQGGMNAANATSDFLTSRGLGRTTAGANSFLNTSYRQGGNIADFLNQSTLALDQRQQDLRKGAGGFLASLPVGTHETGTTHTEGTAGPSSPAAGLFGGATQGLAAMLGQLSASNSLKSILSNYGGGSKSGGDAYYG